GSEDRLAIEFDPNTVKFKTENETMIDVQYVLDGGSFSHPGAPEREGHTFSGWSEDETTEVDDDMTVYAEYSRNAYDLTFDTDSDEGTYTDTYEYGDTIDYPSLSENGREFIGWYADEAFTTLFAEDAMPAQDTTLHARWVEEDTSSINIADMAESVRGSMVSVININEDEGGSGSGVIYKENDDDSYYVFTNHHVVEGHESLEIEYDYNFNQYVSRDSNVEFIGSYAEADIAVIRFTPNPDHSVKAIGFADSYALRTGETVYAYGSPQGPQYAHSMTTGIIGNPLRMERLDDTDAAFIQHDAAISPGNSGGALLDAHGNVIGMNTLKIVSEEVEGMGFALPSNTIQRMVRDLEDDGEVERAVLGVTMTSVENCDYEYGACIDSVDPGTPAETLGLQGGDQVIAFKRASMEDFYTIYNENYLYQAIMDTEVGETITIEYVHDGDIEEESVIME
ncbi:MAG: trypsin-like peptidase domain-containing protein, partial [Candidatus Izemoplasmataceae bacterium]